MANYTITVNSNESSASYERHKGYVSSSYGGSGDFDEQSDGSFSFSLPNLTGATIKSISITAPVSETKEDGGYGAFSMKLGSSTLNTWADNDISTWSVSNLSITGKQSDTLTLDLKHSPNVHGNHSWSGGWWSWTGRTLGRATATITVSMSSPLVLSSPTSGQKINRSSDVIAKWTNALMGSSATTVKSQTLYWKYSSQSAYTSINVGASATTYTFKGGFFKDGTVNWYMSTVDGSGNTYSSSVSSFVISNDFTVKGTAPSDDSKFKRSDSITFKWTNSSIGSSVVSVSSQFLYWKYSNETSYRSINVGASSLSYKVQAGMFLNSIVNWYIASTDNYGYTTKSAVLTFNMTNDFAIEPISPLDGSNIAISLANTFQWTNNMIGSAALPIKSQTLYWRYSNESSYRSVNVGTSATSYTFAKNTFKQSNVIWYLNAVDTYGYSLNTPIQNIKVGIVPSVVISYPKDVNIRTANQQIFTWELKESIATGQKSYELQYKKDSDATWTTVTGTTSRQYHTFAANTFVSAQYTWKIKLTNNDGISTTVVSANFHGVGATEAPNITRVSNSSIPTVYWTISSQDTFEMEIFANTERVYESGVQVGTNVRNFTPNIMLLDGNYIVKMRAMNEYGYFTEWAEYAFVINATKPDPVECVVYANDFHGVNIEYGIGNSTINGLILYILRRKAGAEKWDIIGKMPNYNKFIDNTVNPDVKYEYALRNYSPQNGFADSNIVSIIINYKGSYIYNGNEFVQLYVTEDEQFSKSHTPSKLFSYSFTIGRKYPIRESSEWMEHNTTISCYVTYDEYEKLEEFYESNNDLWFKDKNFSFKCSINSIQITETLLGKGYAISISLSRTDEDEVKLVE